jgi:hypothetical protein
MKRMYVRIQKGGTISKHNNSLRIKKNLSQVTLERRNKNEFASEGISNLMLNSVDLCA